MPNNDKVVHDLTMSYLNNIFNKSSSIEVFFNNYINIKEKLYELLNEHNNNTSPSIDEELKLMDEFM